MKKHLALACASLTTAVMLGAASQAYNPSLPYRVGVISGMDRATSSPGYGTLILRDVQLGDCRTARIDVSYNLGLSMGDPLVSGNWRFWTASGVCTPPHTTVAWLRLEYGQHYGFVKIDPSIPRANSGPGMNATGSPPWNRLVCGFDGARTDGCMSPAQARALWTHGRVTQVLMAW